MKKQTNLELVNEINDELLERFTNDYNNGEIWIASDLANQLEFMAAMMRLTELVKTTTWCTKEVEDDFVSSMEVFLASMLFDKKIDTATHCKMMELLLKMAPSYEDKIGGVPGTIYTNAGMKLLYYGLGWNRPIFRRIGGDNDFIAGFGAEFKGDTVEWNYGSYGHDTLSDLLKYIRENY